MTEAPALARGRELFQRKAWGDSYRLLKSADDEAPLEPEDLERLGMAANLMGRDAESEGFIARAHQMFFARGDCEGAARCASWLAFGLMQRGARAPASGWFARAERILDEAHLDCVVRGFLLIPSAIQRLVQGDPSAGHAAFTQAAEIASRFGDRDLASIACSGRGRALIYLGQITEGVALLDEAMVAVIAGDVRPIMAGDIYCSVLEACQETFDLRRAYEWTVSFAQWCATQSDLVRFRGECLLYRAEVMQWLGKWDDAAQDAQAACELLMSRPAAGAAFYRLAEIHRLRGEFAKADTAYTRANERGRKPQPGLSQLRLAQGQIDAAVAAIRGVLLDTRTPPLEPECSALPSKSCWLPATASTRVPALQSCRRSRAPSTRRCCRRHPPMPLARSSWPTRMSRVRRQRCTVRQKSGGISRRRTKRRKPAC